MGGGASNEQKVAAAMKQAVLDNERGFSYGDLKDKFANNSNGDVKIGEDTPSEDRQRK